MKLRIEVLPKTCWNSNLRTKLKKGDWDKIRKNVYAKEGMRCHICEIQCDSIDAHEVWEFDEIKHIQRLTEIIGVCKLCHNVIHYGRAQKVGYEKEAREQFIKVNACEIIDLQEALLQVQSDYNRRSKIDDWKLDLTLIEEQCYVVNKD
jgi:hypothetical protein